MRACARIEIRLGPHHLQHQGRVQIKLRRQFVYRKHQIGTARIVQLQIRAVGTDAARRFIRYRRQTGHQPLWRLLPEPLCLMQPRGRQRLITRHAAALEVQPAQLEGRGAVSLARCSTQINDRAVEVAFHPFGVQVTQRLLGQLGGREPRCGEYTALQHTQHQGHAKHGGHTSAR